MNRTHHVTGAVIREAVWTGNAFLRTVIREENRSQQIILLHIREVGPALVHSTGWTTGVRSQQALRFSLLATASRPVLGHTQPSIHWVPGALSP
jgi:hypothetical protein